MPAAPRVDAFTIVRRDLGKIELVDDDAVQRGADHGLDVERLLRLRRAC